MFDRYRNFRTFTSPRQVQFGCLAVDPSGELVCAGGRDVFDIFVWSMQTGKLLEVNLQSYCLYFNKCLYQLKSNDMNWLI